MPNNETDYRNTDEKFLYGLATIRNAFRNHPQHETYIEDLALRIVQAYGRIKAGENDLAQAA